MMANEATANEGTASEGDGSTKPIGKVCVVGLGYIGLPTAATIATRGVEVVGVDVNDHVVEELNAGRAHFAEPDLDMLLDAAVTTGQLRAVAEPEPADAFVIAVPTPFHDNKSADLSFVEAATRAVAAVLKPNDLVILESTSPVGTTERMAGWIAEERSDLRAVQDPLGEGANPLLVHLAYCPERILPGRMVFELVENDRIIGGMNEASAERAAALYRLFVRGELLQTTAPLAELVKLAENAYRDVNIAFANELSVLCEGWGLDAWKAIGLANRHPRVNILQPGPGVGGHCIAVDPWFLISAAPDATPLMRAARQVNDAKPDHVLEQVRRHMTGFERPVIACLGLSYKPNVDDLRQSPALKIVEALAHEEAELLVIDPHVRTLPPALANLDNLRQGNLGDVGSADIVLVLVAHKEFARLDPEIIEKRTTIDAVGLRKGNAR